MPTSRNRKRVLVGALFVVGVAAILAMWLAWPRRPRVDEEPPRTFAGPSTQLARTTILLTLDRSIPDQQTGIWCISLQLAWSRLKNDVVKEPVRLGSANELVEEQDGLTEGTE